MFSAIIGVCASGINSFRKFLARQRESIEKKEKKNIETREAKRMELEDIQKQCNKEVSGTDKLSNAEKRIIARASRSKKKLATPSGLDSGKRSFYKMKAAAKAVIQSKMVTRVLALRSQEIGLFTLYILLEILKYFVMLIEQIVLMLVASLGVIGIIIIVAFLVVFLVIMALDVDKPDIDDNWNSVGNSDCIEGGDVFTSNEFDISQIGQLMGTFTKEQKQAAEILTIYSEIINKDLSTVVENSNYINSIKTKMGVTDLIYFLYGFGAVENTGGITNIPVSVDGGSLFKYPSRQTGSDYVFMGLHKTNTFDGTYSYNGLSKNKRQVLKDSFVTEIKTKYVPSETPLHENNFMPYGISTQIGILSTFSIVDKYDKIETELDAIMDKYGIKENREKLKGYVQMFAGSAAYHSGGSETMGDMEAREGLFSLWCALWSTTSENDSSRGFDSVKIINSNYNYTEPQMRVYIFGSNNFYMSWDEKKSDFFEINGKKVDTVLWDWVGKNCTNPDYFNDTAKVWLNTYQGPVSSGRDTMVTDSTYGFVSYIVGRDLAKSIGISAPITSGGNAEDCDCYESGGSSGSLNLGNREFSKVKAGEIQGIYPQEIKDKMMKNTTFKNSFGRLYSLEHPDEKLGSTSKTNEEWRTNSKWKVPYQYQNGTKESWASGMSFSGNSISSACPTFQQAYVYSAMTGKAVNISEITAAKSAYGDSGVAFGVFSQVAKGSGFFVRNMKVTNGVIANYGDGGCSKEEAPILYPEVSLSLKQQIDYVLDNNGIVGVTVGPPSPYTTDKHYFCITEKVGENSYYTHSATNPELDSVTHTLEEIIGKNGAFLFPNFVTNLLFAYNPALSKSNISDNTSNTNGAFRTIVVPKDLVQSGIVGGDDVTPKYDTRGWGWDSKKIRELWGEEQKSVDSIAMLYDCYLVAPSQSFATTGDYFVVYLETGEFFKCIAADAKGDDSAPWGHPKTTYPNGVTKAGISLIEFEGIGESPYNDILKHVEDKGWYSKEVVKIVNYGSILDNPDIVKNNPGYQGSFEDCIDESDTSDTTVADGLTNSKESVEDRWKRVMGGNFSKYYEEKWKLGMTSRESSTSWTEYKKIAVTELESVSIKYWDYSDSTNSNWITREGTIKVHKSLATSVKAMLDEVYALPPSERTPIHNGGIFSYGDRGGGSIHNIGAAIDINPDENPMPGQYGDIKNYKPGVDPYSMSDTSKIVQILEKYGFERGRTYTDYMHFSYFESVSENNKK